MEAIRRAKFHNGGFVDFFWNPIDFELTIKRPGKMAKLSIWRTGVQVCVSRFLKKKSIPQHKNRLPIVDAMDGEIIVDFSNEVIEIEPGQWRPKHGIEKRITMETHTGERNIDARSNTEFIGLVDAIAKSEGKSRSAWMMDALEIYLEDNYQHLWHTWMENRRDEKGRK